MSSDFETLSQDEEYALVVALSEAHDCGNTSCVFCLKLRGSIDIHVMGDPFRLLDKEWRYIWKNDTLRDLRIDFGSIIVIDKLSKFVGNTGKKMVSLVCLKAACFAFEERRDVSRYPAAGNCFQKTRNPAVRNFDQFSRNSSFNSFNNLSNHNYNKIVKSDWVSTALISALIREFKRTVRVMPK